MVHAVLDQPATPLKEQGPVISLYGNIAEPETLTVLKPQTVHLENNIPKALQPVLTEIFRNNAVLFLGCSLQDRFVNRVWEAVSWDMKLIKLNAYAIVPEGSYEFLRAKDMRIRPLRYKKTPGHEGCAEWITG